MRARVEAFTLFALLFLHFVIPRSSLAQNLAFRSLTVNQGLSQSYVQTIFQDADGFMWFATATKVI